ncbi:DUF3536 domain-containing protein [Candidatus Margulisiibacteriota bacterium]
MSQKIKKHICIHGHFYQPPRENPWLEYLEIQDSAYPAHDWNERVFGECYAPNSAARIIDGKGKILKIVNNYEHISFNFGPTLLAWMQENKKGIYQRILAADKKSQKAFKGHGNALAQVYNHIIMPLATDEDKKIQIIWGIKDFEMRFMRKPEGMWLAETAVDTKTLEILAENEIKFTILSPYQAQKFRKITNNEWQDVGDGSIDPKRPYLINLPSGKKISVFFYDGHISKGIAFDGLLNSSEALIKRLMTGFAPDADPVQLVSVATDGESYGHHKKFGDMALAHALEQLQKNSEVKLINYAAFLELYPPEYEVQIFENSSWSCIHGVGRWANDCGCSTSGQPGWDQKWREPLRTALDYLRDLSSELYHRKLSLLLKDYEEVIYKYYDVIHKETLFDDRKAFLKKHLKRELNEKEIEDIYKILEIKRNANLMYTSCGWFFAEISGIETIQILKYAARVIQLLEGFEIYAESKFLDIIKEAGSNKKEYINGANIYQKLLKPKIVDLRNVAIHFAINSLFEDYTDMNKVYAYEVECLDLVREIKGMNKFAFGNVKVTSERTKQIRHFQFAVLHYGETDFHCAIENYENKSSYKAKKDKISKIFREAHLTELVQELTQEFGKEYFSLRNVFTSEKREILKEIMASEVDRLSSLMVYMTQKTKRIIEYCSRENMPIPKPLVIFNEYTYQKVIEHIFTSGLSPQDLYQQVNQVAHLIELLKVEIDLTDLKDYIKEYVVKTSEKCFEDLNSVAALSDFLLTLRSANLLSRSIHLWNVENEWFEFFKNQHNKLDILSDRAQIILREIKELLGISI